jgi:hypothetical protein
MFTAKTRRIDRDKVLKEKLYYCIYLLLFIIVVVIINFLIHILCQLQLNKGTKMQQSTWAT